MDRFYPLDLPVAANTLSTGPITQNVTLENAALLAIELVVPPGHGGFTGIRFRQSRQQILPWGNSGWIIANDYTNTFPVNTEIGSKAMSVQAYNEDVYSHTFFIRFHIRDLHAGEETSVGQSASGIIGLITSPGFDEDTPTILPPTTPLPNVPSLPPLPGAPILT